MAGRGSWLRAGDCPGVLVCLMALVAYVPAPVAAGQTPGSHLQPSRADAAKPSADEQKKPDAAKDDEKDKDEPRPKAFAEVVKKAREIPGLFTVHRTDEKTYLEVKSEQWDTMYMLSLTCESGLGERGFYAAQMCGEAPIVLRREGKRVQLVARNPRFTAADGTAIARSVARSFSDSVIGSTTIESLPHPTRRSELVDLDALLLTDLPNAGYVLEETFRIPYRLDAKGSSFTTLQGFERNVEIETRLHYAAERLPVPPLPGPGPRPELPPPPRNVPDPRSLLLTFRYSLAEMPADGYRPRLADDRVGHFFSQVEDYTTDVAHETARRYITRWRLEKDDPSAAVSRPKQPIVFWLENTIPEKYRDAVRAGVLMWNPAFEKIGFTDAIEVRQQPDDSDWDPADVRYSTIRWFTATDAGFAIGPSRANPFTGEIYDADISFSESMTRFQRQDFIEEVQPVRPAARMPSAFQPPWSANRLRTCDLARGAALEAGFAFDLLAARGLPPDGPEADEFVNSFLKYVTAHEVGHTLGLRHNFHASTIHGFADLHDAARTGAVGLTGSVMDYVPANLAIKGSPQGELFQSVVGPYDYWAVEYAYKPIDASSPEGELPALRAIAARGAADPQLAYATDEDAGFFGEPLEIDPMANRWDLGSEPLTYYAHRMQLSHELWKNAEATLLREGEGYQVLRRSFMRGLYGTGYSAVMAAKYVGGVRHHRDHVGDGEGRVPFDPIPAAQQAAAFALLKTQFFAPDAFVFSPALLRKLGGERYPDWVQFERMLQQKDVPVHALVLEMQGRVLNRLLHRVVLARLVDAPLYLDPGHEPFSLAVLFYGLEDAIWAELPAKGSSRQAAQDVNSHRRALQRLHLKKLGELVVRDAAAPEDARSEARRALIDLRDRLREVSRARQLTAVTRAHVDDSLARVEQILAATVTRTAF
jgi:hypothetical protein